MDLAHCMFEQTKLKPVFTSIMNIWASVRTMKSKRIPRQRNYFIQEQNLHSWTGDLGFSFLTGPVCEPLQGGLLWAVSYHGHALPYMGKCQCQTTPQCSCDRLTQYLHTVCPKIYFKHTKPRIGMSSKSFFFFFLKKQCLQMDMVLYLYGRESEVKEGCLSLEQGQWMLYFLSNLFLQAWTNF